MTTKWIGPDESLKASDYGFLVQKSHDNNGWDRYELRDTPPYTNRSIEPRLEGWCGTYNNVATYGCGMWRVERLARNGRAFIRKLEGGDLLAALEELGYPELMPEEES